MSSADQLLAQQANQSIAFMQAIGRNTQQAFENRSRVQQAELSAGIQVASQMEQYRMNDAKLKELNQVMQLRLEQHEWDKKNQAFAEQLRPLEFKARQLQLENQFRMQAEQRMKPFLADIQGEFQQLIMDKPELASEAQSIYANGIDGILTKGTSDPSIDIGAEIGKKKEEMRQWIQKKKAVDLTPALKGLGISAANSMLGTFFDPLKPIKDAEKKVELDRDDVSRAATIYAGFGGNPKDFILKYDPDEKMMVNTTYRTSMATGVIPPVEVLQRMPIQMQKSLLQRAEQVKNVSALNATSKSIVDQISELRIQDSELMKADLEPKNAETIAGLVAQLDTINRERAKAMGYEIEPLNDDEGTGINVEELTNKVLGSGSSTDTATQQKNNADRVFSITNMLNPKGRDIANEIRIKIDSGKPLEMEDVEKLTSGVSDAKIVELVKQPWFIDHIRAIQPVEKAVPQYGVAGSSYKPEQTPEGKISASVYAIQNLKGERRNDAIKYLKSSLPTILFRYANQQ